MAQQLRVQTALAEDLSSFPSTHTGMLTTAYYPTPGDPVPSPLSSGTRVPALTCTHADT